MTNRTQWFPGSIKPVHVGVYERAYRPGKILFCYWNGKNFGCGYDFKEDAEMNAVWASLNQNLPWRGLARRPK